MHERIMRVLVIAQLFPPDMGGGATRAYNVVKGLLSLGCNVTVVAAVPHYPSGNIPKKYRWSPLVVEYSNNLKVIRTFVLPLASKGFGRRLLLFISFMVSSLFSLPLIRKVDVVWAANPNILSFFPAFLFKLVKGCPVVLNVDDLFVEVVFDLNMIKSSVFRRLAEVISKVAYKASFALTPISLGYVDTIVNKYGIEPKKLHVIPAGVDLHRFNVRKDRNEEESSGEFRVLYIGAFSPAYDFEQVLRAVKLLEGEDKIRIVLQGGGEMAPVLRNKMKELNLKNVELVERIVSREEVAKILMDANALLLPLSGLENIEKGISSKLYEYQAAGKPIICCSSGIPGRYVSDTGSGVVVKPGDYEALAKAVLYLRENRGVAEKLGESGRRYVENNLSVKNIGLKMIAVFNQVLRNPSRIHKAEHEMV